MLPEDVRYEALKNRVEPFCATCIKKCKVVYEAPYAASRVMCSGYYPQPKYHDRLWNWGAVASDLNYTRGFCPEFLKHAEQFHPLSDQWHLK